MMMIFIGRITTFNTSQFIGWWYFPIHNGSTNGSMSTMLIWILLNVNTLVFGLLLFTLFGTIVFAIGSAPSLFPTFSFKIGFSPRVFTFSANRISTIKPPLRTIKIGQWFDLITLCTLLGIWNNIVSHFTTSVCDLIRGRLLQQPLSFCIIPCRLS